MSLQHFGKGALRVAKNYTKGYSDSQAKVRDATSNDPWGPSGTQMNEIAQLTFNQQDFVEVMEMLDKRLNDKGKNWRHVFKALTVLDYCLHAGSENVVLYFKDNIYVIKTLKEFQYIDEDMKDQGANVRQKAKDITNLLQDEGRLREQRKSRAHMRDRMVGSDPVVGGGSGEFDNENEVRRNRPPANGGAPSGRRRKDEDDLRKAIEESKRSLADEQQRQGMMTAEERDLAAALKLSEEEEAKRKKMLEDSNQTALFNDGTQLDAPQNGNNPFPLVDTSLIPQQTSLQPQFTANPYWAAQQQQQAAAQQQAQAEYEWNLMQQQQQQLQQQQLQAQQMQQMQAQAQQEEWMRQQQMLQAQQQAQQQQQQAQMFFQQQQQQQQQLFSPMQPQPTGFGSNNPFAAATGGGFLSPQSAPPMPSFTPSTLSASPGITSPSPQQQLQAQPTSSPQPPPSPTSANTLANARRPQVKTNDQNQHLASLFANRDDGLDSFGNVGTLRFGHSFAGQLQSQPTGTNPFAKNTDPQQQQRSEQPFFQI